MTVIGSNALAGASGQGGSGYEIERSLRFNSGDIPSLKWTPSSSGDTKTFTFSCWFKRSHLTQVYTSIIGSQNASAVSGLYVTLASDCLQIGEYSTNAWIWNLQSTAVFRDPTAWYHLVVSIDTTQATASNRVKYWVNGSLITEFNSTYNTYPSQNHDIQFNDSGRLIAIGPMGLYNGYVWDGYLADIHFIDGQAKDVLDFGKYDDNNVWQPKKYDGTYGTNGFHLDFSDNSSNSALGTDSSGNGNNFTVNNLSAVDGHPYSTGSYVGALWSGAAWANAFDGNLATRVLTYTTTTSTLTLATPASWSSKIEVYAAHYGGGIFINGQNASPTWSSTPSTEQWYDITSIVGSSGTINTIGLSDINNGDYTSLYAIRLDNTILVDTFGTADSFRDSPTNGDPTNDTGAGGELSGNYCIWDVNNMDSYGSANYTLTNGNLEVVNVSQAYGSVPGNMFFDSGKWYWEMHFGGTTNGYEAVGIMAHNPGLRTYPGDFVGAYWYVPGGNKVSNAGGWAGTSYGSSWNQGDIIGIALDADNKTVTFYKNGVSQGTAFTNLSSTSKWGPAVGDYSNSPGVNFILNAGQHAFTYAAPSGYKCLCTANLPDPTIADGSTAFDIVTYTSDGSSRTISGLNMSPDLVWSKRTSAGGRHVMTDSVRGVNKEVFPNMSSPERTSTDGLTAFNSDGYTLGADASQYGWQANGATFINWAWDAGSSNTTIAAGGLNSSLYDQSDVWSDNAYADPSSATAGLTNLTNAFDGTLANNNLSSFHGEVIFPEIQFASGVTEVIVYAYYSGNTDWWVKLNQNGTQYNLGQQTIVHAVGQIPSGGVYIAAVKLNLNETSITRFSFHGAGNHWFAGVSVNGKLLVNSNTTPPNVPSVASTVRANPSAGFSIVTYTGTANSHTVAHNLNATPEFFIGKDRATGSWYTYHKDLDLSGSSSPKDYYVTLNGTGSAANLANCWGSSAPTSTMFGDALIGYAPGVECLFYVFAPVEGYSAFGSYTGNNSADGPFVYTGFRPAFILTKGIDDAEDWYIRDTTSSPFNPCDEPLRLDSGSYWSGRTIDIMSNGFKITDSDNQINQAGKSYLYAAWAEHPFKTARAR